MSIPRSEVNRGGMMSTPVKITVEQYEAMIDRGEFDPLEEHHVELIRGEIVPRFGDDPRIPMNPPHASRVDHVTEWSFEVAPRELVRIRVQGAVSISDLDSVPSRISSGLPERI